MAQGSTRFILSHRFFNGFDVASLENGSMVPSLIVPPISNRDGNQKLPPVKPFRGNQSMFSEF